MNIGSTFIIQGEASISTPYNETGTDIDRTAVLKDPTCLYSGIEKTTGISTLDGLEYKVYVLNRNLRNRIITPELSKELMVNRSGFFSSFVHGAELKQAPEAELKQKELMKAAIYGKPDSTDAFPRENIGVRCSGTDRSIIDGITAIDKDNNDYKLPRPDKKNKGELLAIYNKKQDGKVKIAGKQLGLTLNSASGAILQVKVPHSGSAYWSVISQYKTEKKRSNVNPLLVDVLPPGASPGHCPGEPFLKPSMVQDLAKSIPGITKPDFCQYDEWADKYFTKLLINKSANAITVLMPSTMTEHVVAVRLILKDNCVFVYIHEPLGADDPIAHGIEDRIIEIVRRIYGDYDIYLLKPGYTLQKDVSCCTQFALELIQNLHEFKDIDGWIIDTALDAKALIHKAPVQRASRRSGGGTDTELSTRGADGQKFCVPVDKAHVQLLKGNQNKDLLPDTINAQAAGQSPSHSTKITLKQMEEFIDPPENTITLEQHYKKHTRSVSGKESGDTSSDVNLFATGTRYQNLMQWSDLNDRKITAAAMAQNPTKNPLTIAAASTLPTDNTSKKESISPVSSGVGHKRSQQEPPGEEGRLRKKRLKNSESELQTIVGVKNMKLPTADLMGLAASIIGSNNAQHESMAEEIKELKKVLKERGNYREEQLTLITSQSQQIKEQALAIKELTQKEAGLTEQATSLMQTIKDKGLAIEGLTQEKAGLTQKTENLTQTIKDQERVIEGLTQEKAGLTQKTGNLTQTIKDKDLATEGLTQEKAGLTQKTENLTQTIKDKDRVIEGLIQEKSGLTEQAASLVQTIKDKDLATEGLTQEKADLTQKSEDLTREIQTLKAGAERLNSAFQSWNDTLAGVHESN